MEKQTILILGISGMLGHKLFTLLCNNPDFEVYGSLRSFNEPELIMKSKKNSIIIPDLDISDLVHLENEITRIKPVWVINCIGIIKQKKDAQNTFASISVNSMFPHQLARICLKQNAKVLHFSTDCVFSGKKGNYKEEDLSDAPDIYGKTKYLGELDYPNSLTIRTSIIGHELSSDYGLLEWFLSQQNKVKGYSKAVFSGFTTIELANIIVKFILKQKLSGLYHVSSSPINKYDLLKGIAGVYKKDIEISDYRDFVCDRSLDSSKFIAATGYKAPSWEQMITDMHEDYILNYKSLR